MTSSGIQTVLDVPSPHHGTRIPILRAYEHATAYLIERVDEQLNC